MVRKFKVPMVVARCVNCEMDFVVPDQTQLPYATFLLTGENGTVYRASEALCNPVWELVESLGLHGSNALTGEVVARLADRCAGQQLRFGNVCPSCHHSAYPRKPVGKAKGEIVLNTATFRRLTSQSSAKQRSTSQSLLDELRAQDGESKWLPWLRFVSIPAHREDIVRRVQDAKGRRVGYAAIIRFRKLHHATRISRDELQPIASAVESRFTAVSSLGCELLLILTGKSQTAQQLWLKLAESPSAETRFHVVAWTGLKFGTPRSVVLELITKRLNDKGDKGQTVCGGNCWSLQVDRTHPCIGQTPQCRTKPVRSMDDRFRAGDDEGRLLVTEG